MEFGGSNSSLGGISTRIRQVFAGHASAGLRQVTPRQPRTSEQANFPDVPDFELLLCIGHGSYGEVWLARNIVGSYRAVKMINRKAFRDEEAFDREFFGVQRFEPISREHAGFVEILHVGRDRTGGFFYYVMELADDDSGGDLINPDAYTPRTLSSELARCGRLSVKESAQLGLSLTDALIQLHQRGLVHRDIKPSNIIFIKGQAKLADIGLVTHAGEKKHLGTEGYISPEGPGTGQGDLYSLGKLLYEASTGTDRLEYPDLPHDIDTMTEREAFLQLNSIILKACDNDIRKRYRTATEMNDDLAQLGVLKKPVPAVRRNVRRYQIIAFSIVSLVALTTTVSLLVWKSNFFYSPLPKSIAVLPFENLSENKQDSYLADGIQDEILSDLAKVADLKVISRTSVMQYKSGIARNLRDIGRQLGVAYVVEGGVQHVGNRVHVNAQLLDTHNRHLWSQSYDGELSDIFTVESDVVRTVAQQLQAKLSPAEKEVIERPPTNDVIAFDFYTGAKNLLLRTGIESSAAILLPAIDLLKQAVARDPSFFDAYCQLAWANDFLYVLGHDHTPARLTLAETAIQAASRLRPNAGETHLARAWNYYWGYLDYDNALVEVERARATLPNDPQIFQLTGYIQRRQGRWEEAARSLERAVDLDPRNLFTLQQIAYSYLYLRRYAEEKAAYDRILEIEPNDAVTKVARTVVELNWKANTRPLHQLIDSIRAAHSVAMPSYVTAMWLLCALAERDTGVATDALSATVPQEAPFANDAVHFSRPFMEGIIAWMAKDDTKALSAFTAARAEQEKIAQAQPDYGPALCVLGLIDAALGRKEEALREGRRAVELLPVEKDAINGPLMIEYLAMIAAWIGDKDLACEQLAIASRLPHADSYGELKLLPFWDPLRGDPRFEQIVASLAPK